MRINPHINMDSNLNIQRSTIYKCRRMDVTFHVEVLFISNSFFNNRMKVIVTPPRNPADLNIEKKIILIFNFCFFFLCRNSFFSSQTLFHFRIKLIIGEIKTLQNLGFQPLFSIHFRNIPALNRKKSIGSSQLITNVCWYFDMDLLQVSHLKCETMWLNFP